MELGLWCPMEAFYPAGRGILDHIAARLPGLLQMAGNCPFFSVHLGERHRFSVSQTKGAYVAGRSHTADRKSLAFRYSVEAAARRTPEFRISLGLSFPKWRQDTKISCGSGY